MSPGLFFGAGIHFWGGEYENTKRFRELDEKNLIPNFLDSTSTDHLKDEFSGVNISFGVLLKLNDQIRIGASIVSPVTLKTDENWDYTDTYQWEDGYQEETSDAGSSTTKIHSPWIMRAGLSLNEGPVLVSAETELINYTEFKYLTDPPELKWDKNQVNLEIQRAFRNVMNYRIGAELTLPRDIQLRGGYAFYPSHIKNAGSGVDRKVYSIGAGLKLMDQVRFDFSYGYTSWSVYPPFERNIFQNTYKIDEKIEARNFLFTFSYLM
jgi:long-subunit fatty acid transport protein